MSNISGILRLTNDNKELIVKIEDLIDISNNFYAKISINFKNAIIANLFLNHLKINGQPFSSQYTFSIGTFSQPTSSDLYTYQICDYENVKSAILSLSLDDQFDFDDCDYYNIILMITINDTTTYNIPIYITKNIINQYEVYDKQAHMIASNMESFMLLRTNPKLTGNVKLVVDENYNLYLDTFKISSNSILNKQEYRHQAISSDGNYPYDVYRIFKFLPATEMYGIYPDSYDPHISYHKMDDQIRNIYEYGAEYNSDKLYSENFKILAPLYIGKHLPDYFAIWRTDRLITDQNIVTNTEVFKNLLNDGQCIKIFDLRRSTSIGKYLHEYQNMITKYHAGTCALQFIEQDNDKNSIDHRQGQNTWKGIAYDKGILTDRNETTYFASKTINGNAPQENFDMFLLNGYSRNNLLFPNIINLEYMFNDTDAEDFSMHNYFGLYLTENDFITFNQVLKLENDDNNYNLLYYDTSNNIVDLNSLPIDVIDDQEFINRIFFATTANAVTDLKTIKDLNTFTKNEAVNIPKENIVQLDGNVFKMDKEEKAFISMDFTAQIKYGEHFKFIIPKYKVNDTKSKCVIFEIIASNDERLKNVANYISPYVQTNKANRLTPDENEEETEIYRIAFYSQDIKDSSKQATLKEQILRIGQAIKKFDNVLKVGSNGDESISIISSVKDVYFQHILADEFINGEKEIEDTKNLNSNEWIDLNNYQTIEQTDTRENIEYPNDTLRYYNYNNIQKCEYIEYNNNLYDTHFIGYANNGLEETLERYANITKFINVDEFENNFIYEIEKDIYEETNNVAYPLIYTMNGYYPMVKFKNNNGDLTFIINKFHGSKFALNNIEYISIISPYHVDKSIICSPYEIEFINGHINICSPINLNIALMGINDIKDIDVYVNNDVQENHYTSVSSTFKAGEKVKIDNTDSRIRKFVSYSIISGSIYGIPTSALNSFTILPDKIIYTNAESNTINEIKLEIDYIEFNEDTIIMLVSTNSLDLYNYAVIYPILNEINYFNDSIHTDKSNLIIPLVPLVNCQWKSNGQYFDTLSLLDVNCLGNDYEITGNFIESKYTPSQNGQYIIDSLDDIINVDGVEQTIFDYFIHTGSLKKYLCANNKIETAIGYYNPYVQTLEFIFYGLKFIFKLSSNEFANEIKLNEFDNFEVFVINDFDNSDTNKIIISKKEEFILIINHTYKSSYYYGNSDIKVYKDNLIQDIDYDWFKLPYNYELANISNMNNIYVNKSNTYILNDLNDIKSFIEIDLNTYSGEYSGFNEKPIYAYFTVDSGFKSFDNYDIYDTLDNVYIIDISTYTINNNISKLVNYYFDINSDFRQKNKYVIKKNDTPVDEIIGKSYADKLNDYIESFNNNFDIYIIENETNLNESIEPIRITNDYKPLTIEITKPNKVKYNNGLFNPNFVNIFEFKLNDNISNRIGLDTLYGNTCVSSINSIKNYYNNKVILESATYTYNYFIDEYRSPFSTNWDNNIYKQYKSENEYDNMQGYAMGIDDKMFFGSKALNLHNNSITLNKWNYEKNVNSAKYNISKQNEHSKQKKILEITLNLTKTFYDYFLNLNSFVDNWKNVKNYTNVKVYINNYINNVLYNLYNFKGNFDIILYKKYVENAIKKDNIKDKSANYHFIMSTSNINEFDEIETNYKTEFDDINNEVILTLTIYDYENYIYYPIVKINKI